jgi:hypothetical protein
MKKRV